MFLAQTSSTNVQCSGAHPCLMCQTRNKECTYTIVDKRTLKGEKAARERRLAFEARIKESPHEDDIIQTPQQHGPPPINQHHQLQNHDLYYSPTTSPRSLLNQSPITPSPSAKASFPVSHVGPMFPVNFVHPVNSSGPHISPPATKTDDPIACYMSYITNTNPLHNYNPGAQQVPINTYPQGVPPYQMPVLTPPVQKSPSKFTKFDDLKYSILAFGDCDKFTYVGDCNIATFLKECRNYFEMFIGPSKFSSDILEGEVEEKPVHIPNANSPAMSNEPKSTIQLPIRYKCDALVENFRKFINVTYFTLDMAHFHDQVLEEIYKNPLNSDKEKLSILYLVLSIGQIIDDYSVDDVELKKSYVYFENGINLVEAIEANTSSKVDRVWCIQINYLIFFYCFISNRKKASYEYLSKAINIGLKDGFLTKNITQNSPASWFRKQLFKSLVLSDTICSVLLAKPFVIPPAERAAGSKDFNLNIDAAKAAIDLDKFPSAYEKDKSLQDVCSTELVNIFTIISKIISQIYTGNIIDAESTQETTYELKSWILRLPRTIQVDRYLADTSMVTSDYGHLLVLIHCSQLYAILLLSRPFLLLEMLFKLKPELKSRFLNHQLISTFNQVAIKSSTLALVMIKYYCDVSKRVELILIVEITFFCCLIIGIRLVNGSGDTTDESSYKDQELIEILKIGLDILVYYSAKNPASYRLSIIVQDMLSAVLQHNDKVKHKNDFNDMLSKMLALDTHLSEIDDFQKSFVADETFSPKTYSPQP